MSETFAVNQPQTKRKGSAMKSKQQYGIMAGLLAVVLGASAARATIVIQPVSVQASSYYSSGPDVRPPGATINGSGLSNPALVTTGSPIPATWPTHDAGSQDGWLTLQATSTITWFLGDRAANLTGLHLWNYNEGGQPTRGISNTVVSVSSDGITFTPITTEVFADAPHASGYVGDEYSLTATDVHYVKFQVLSSWGGGDGISEIRFEGALIPEPSLVMLLGVGAGLLWLRRR